MGSKEPISYEISDTIAREIIDGFRTLDSVWDRGRPVIRKVYSGTLDGLSYDPRATSAISYGQETALRKGSGIIICDTEVKEGIFSGVVEVKPATDDWQL